MAKKGYDKCIDLMKQIKKEGYEVEISAVQLAIFIKKYIGVDIRTIQSYKDNLVDFKFIKPKGNGVYTIETITKELF